MPNQSSRRRIPPNTVCYLCGRPIADDEPWNRDHIPPERFFAHVVKVQFNPQLQWLYTHASCNSAYREDEEYAIAVLAGHAKSPVGDAVIDDLRRAIAKGHSRGLLKAIVNAFGTVTGPRGERVFQIETHRIHRFIWKLVRGIYFLELGRVLPEDTPRDIRVITPYNAPTDLPQIPWFPIIRDTEPLARYGNVFDYKWIGQRVDAGIRGHMMALLLWDGIIVLILFHDPTCSCIACFESSDASVSESAPRI